MGLDPPEMAREMVALDLRRTGGVDFFTPARDTAGSYRPERQQGADVDAYAEGWRRIWHDKETAAIRDLYCPGASVAIPDGDTLSGHGDIDRFCIAYLASFPDAVLTWDCAIVNRDPGQPIRIATRWSLQGHHLGFVYFGPPTGAPVYVIGLSHAHLVNGRVTAEWIVTDEVSFWKQILAHRGSQAGA
jgi:hypothetical protein